MSKLKVIQEIKETMSLPVIVAPMFLISNPTMVIESCKAGVIGTFPALNARTGKMLEEWMQQIKTELEDYKVSHSKATIPPWGVNFIAHRSNKRYEEDLAQIKKYKPPLIITSLGDPSPIVKIAHEYGGIVFSDVINTDFARKAIEKGADGLVLVTNGAGGHGGTLNPVAFINEVKKFYTGPIVLAGGLSNGEDVLAAEIIGADFSYVGTRFIAVDESSAEKAYKEMIVKATIDDIIYTDAFSGINGNYLIPSIKRAGLDPMNLEQPAEVNFDKTNKTDVKVWKDIWSAGQGVGAVTKVQSIKEVVDELQTAYKEAIYNLKMKK